MNQITPVERGEVESPGSHHPPNGSLKPHNVSLWPTVTYFKNGIANNKITENNGTNPSSEHKVQPPSFTLTALHPHALIISFDQHDEKVYKSYFRRQRLGVLPVLVAMSTVHAIQCLVLDLVPGFRLEILDRVILVCVAALLVFILFVVVRLGHMGDTLSECLAGLMWFILTVQIYYDIGTSYPRHLPSDMIGWVLILIFATQMTIPLGPWLGLPFICLLVLVHCIMVGVLWSQDSTNLSDIGNQVAANVLLCAASTCVGFAGSLFSDRLTRRSVMEIKSALTAKTKIEVAYKNKERLLLSVLPRHVAEEMLKDVGNLADGQFRKIYMKRYENVSILFADIVGFTAISSTVTAAELVKILNELFASFDVLANKFHQVRIKILGDCYYCVCGALEPRTDHAVLTIHMGLSMVDAISSVRQSTGKDVNMRVGVHTGACLGGVLGQRQWQFDVLGKEVTLANKMESGGLPARVHVSQATANFLNGEFELEDGHGGEREEELKLKNVTTYLIKAVLKPYPEGTLDRFDTGSPTRAATNGRHHKSGHASRETAPADQELSSDDEASQDSLTQEAEQRKAFSTRLQRELIERETERGLFDKFYILIHKFKDTALEQRYQRRSESYSGIPIVAMCPALLLLFVAKLCLLPRGPLPIALFMVGELILVAMAVVSMTLTFASRFPPSMVRFATAIDVHWLLKLLWGVSACTVFFICDTAPVAECDEVDQNLTLITHLDLDHRTCHYIIYFTHSACVVLIIISSMVNLNHMIKAAMIVVVVCIHCLIILVFVEQPFHNYDIIVYQGGDGVHTHIKYRLLGQTVSVAVALHFYNSQMEFTARKLYLWKEDSKSEKEKAADMKIKNESLVYNLLPAHVAKDFLGRRKRDAHADVYVNAGVIPGVTECQRSNLYMASRYGSLRSHGQFNSSRRVTSVLVKGPIWINSSCGGRVSLGGSIIWLPVSPELYSHSYDEVGVLFAACPNFTDFYSETSINNDGLECLRFLNEIISDYDELLNLPRFNNIVKIKTVGPTYMAASGMVDTEPRQAQTITEKWSHLHDLVQFSLALHDVINKINEQSFNNFILRIGINHGPIIAGVIGARKPHYDIWGNTVNVSSRMESTGQPGRVQVVEETKTILEEFGYTFEKRGLIKVKGKGELMTYFMVSVPRNDKDYSMPSQVSGR